MGAQTQTKHGDQAQGDYDNHCSDNEDKDQKAGQRRLIHDMWQIIELLPFLQININVIQTMFYTLLKPKYQQKIIIK